MVPDCFQSPGGLDAMAEPPASSHALSMLSNQGLLKDNNGRNNSGLNRLYPPKGNIYSGCNHYYRIVSVNEPCYRNQLSAS